MNVCTDQLAMLLAGEGQLHSVSDLANRADVSVLAGEASHYIANHGRAEEIFVMHPDLVIAGTFTARPAIDMLKRLGFRVEVFAPESSFADIRAGMLRMGELLDRQQHARALVAQFDDEVAALEAATPAVKPVAALYYANSYTSGSGTLADAVVEKAGLTNFGRTLGLVGTVKLPLETLVVNRPDLIVTGRRYGNSGAQATDIFDHPALRAAMRHSGEAIIADRYWVCGLPFTLEAARRLAAAARSRPEPSAR